MPLGNLRGSQPPSDGNSFRRHYVSLNRAGAELLFQLFADRYERSSTLITNNLAFAEWTQVFQGERMTAALLNAKYRATHSPTACVS